MDGGRWLPEQMQPIFVAGQERIEGKEDRYGT